jgi:hypothetical protein
MIVLDTFALLKSISSAPETFAAVGSCGPSMAPLAPMCSGSFSGTTA